MIKVYQGELGREKFLCNLCNIDNREHFHILPVRGELISLKSQKGYDIWRVKDVLHDYEANEIGIFVERYIWPNERTLMYD